jgi:NADH-quinone oxidoreductase subunit H
MTPEIKGFLLATVIKVLAIFTITLVGVAYLTLVERKVCAWMQYRLGPNRVGPNGWFQPLADGLKNILKEETFPAGANAILFVLAPALSLIPATMMTLVLPWAAPIPVKFDFTLPLVGRFAYDALMPIAAADLPVGFLFVIAVGSMGVYGIALAGWSSNNKYSLLGGLRASAQMVSYEVAIGMSLVPVVLLCGNVAFGEIITRQQHGWWFVGPLFLSAFIFLVSSFAETNRVPFDLPESESELVAGYHTEYSAMKFSLFFIAEYANMITASAMTVVLFFGGWDIPFTHWDETPGLLQSLVTGVVMFLKTFAFIFTFIWVRWTLPRFRYDQLMALGWKVMVPLGLVYVMLIGVAVFAVDALLPGHSDTLKMGVLFLLNLPLIYLVFLVFDRGHLISGAAARRPATDLDRAA